MTEEKENYEQLETCLGMSIESLQQAFKQRSEQLRECRKGVELTRISEKKVPDLLAEVKKVEKEAVEITRSIGRLSDLLKTYGGLRAEVSNLLLAMERYATEIKDVKLLHTVKVEQGRFSTANKIV
jgi:uncharacterized protein Yka (UPF0111/DUF47 family)